MRWTRRATLLAATAAIVVVVAACVPIKPGPPAAPSIPFGSAHPQAQELYYLVNAERAANGLGPVGWHDQLGGLAQGWSEHMAGSGNFSYQNLDAILQSPGYSGFSGLGENIIHGGCGISSSQLHQAWPHHSIAPTSSATSTPSASASRATAASSTPPRTSDADLLALTRRHDACIDHSDDRARDHAGPQPVHQVPDELVAFDRAEDQGPDHEPDQDEDAYPYRSFHHALTVVRITTGSEEATLTIPETQSA